MIPNEVLICEKCHQINDNIVTVCACGHMALARYTRHYGIRTIIRHLRKTKGITQADLAKSAGVKQPNLSRIENGLCEPRRGTLEKLATALQVPITELSPQG